MMCRSYDNFFLFLGFFITDLKTLQELISFTLLAMLSAAIVIRFNEQTEQNMQTLMLRLCTLFTMYVVYVQKVKIAVKYSLYQMPLQTYPRPALLQRSVASLGFYFVHLTNQGLAFPL